MSLDDQQRRVTASELAENLRRSGLSESDLAHRVGWTDARLARTLRVDVASPADVWTLRDTLVRAVKDAGGEPAPFSVLSESRRREATMWFGVSSDAPGVG